MVGRLVASLLMLVYLGSSHRTHAKEQSFGYCGGSFTKPHKRDPEESSPKFKNKVKNYVYQLEKDIPLVRPKNMGFRIKVWPTQVFFEIVINDTTMKDQYKKVMNNALTFFHNLLGVYPHNQTNVYNASDCLKTSQPLQPKGINYVLHESQSVYINVTGYDHHLVIDLGLQDPCEEDGNTLGWAHPCVESAKYERGSKRSKGDYHTPGLISVIYLCQSQLTGDRMQDNKLEQTIKHEVLHNLGISNGHLVNSKKDILRKTIEWESAHGTYEKNVTYNTNQLVIEAARNHFNCATLSGGEVEDSGGPGTADSHWEMRVFGPILMVGMISRQSYFSNISVSLLRGLLWKNNRSQLVPWYPWVNVSMAEDQWYGKNAGCAFAKQSCREYIYNEPMKLKMPRAPSFPFASPGNMRSYWKWNAKKLVVLGTCSPNKLSVMYCGIDHGSTVSNNDKQNMYLYYHGKGVNRMQGTNQLTEYCPVYSDVPDEFKDTYCKNEHSKPPGAKNPGGEVFGANSGCFEQTVPFTKVNCSEPHLSRVILGQGKHIDGYSGAGCYKFLCKHKRLLVQAAGDDGRYGYKVCWAVGTNITIRRMIDDKTFVHGTLICPSCRVMCGEQFPCAPDVPGIEPRDQLETPCVKAACKTTAINLYGLVIVNFYFYSCINYVYTYIL